MTRGIFDPWRQTPAPVLQRERDPEAERQLCINFRGDKVGVHVWLYADDDPADAQTILADIVQQLYKDPKAAPFLEAATVPRTGPVTDITRLGWALRAAIRHSAEVETLLKNAGVRPYVF